MLSLHQIRQKAYQLGFVGAGATNDFTPKHRSYFLDWLNQKKHGQMNWLSRNTDKRLDPQTLMSGTQTALVLSTSYAHEPLEKDYKLARYAYGQDYHVWVKEKVEALAHWIESQCDFAPNWRAFVDTGPVIERDLAFKAGLGWIGKNTQLINPDNGSYLFLSVLFLNFSLNISVPSIDLCGSCTLCLNACPTQALTPYKLDAQKCLAYHNIELKGERDRTYAAQMQDRLVGCDICQEVCPYNLQVPQTSQSEWLKTFEAFDLGDLKNILQLTQDRYKQKIKGSAISRLKYDDFMRNVFLVIGNLKRRDLLPEILYWQKMNPVELKECVWCLQELQKK